MTRFTDIDLARLPALPIGTDTLDAIRLARCAEIADRMEDYGFTFDVGMLRTDPLIVANAEAGAARELLAISRRDDAIRAVLLATSWGAFLDALGASQLPAVARKILVPADAASGTPAVMEADDDFRRRIQLAPETLSAAGPEGAYLSIALSVDGVKAALPYGPMSFGGTYDAPFTPLGCVHVPIVSSTGDGAASEALVAAVQAALSPKDRRPLADFVTVSAAAIVPYTVEATIRVGAGADPGIVLTAAIKRVRAQVLRQHRPSAPMKRQMLYGALYVPDATGAILVDDVDLVVPAADVNAAPIAPGTTLAAYSAPWCDAGAVDAEPVLSRDGEILVGTLGDITVRLETVDD